jgi:CxxC motif-containing protein (DUF1111 family)
MMKYSVKIITLTSLVILGACTDLLPDAPAENELLDGPIEGLSFEEQRQFLLGDIAFNDAVFTPETGLGPFFVASSCGSCHIGDGKGHPFTSLTRFGQSAPGDNLYLDLGGPQLQNRAIPGHTPEELPAGVTFAKITPPATTGLGFLEALTDAQLLANADPNDADGDGISGVPNYVNPPDYFEPLPHHEPLNGLYIGRFGKKAAAINLLHQTANAYQQDMGITSEFNPDEPSMFGKPNQVPDNVEDPEVSKADVNNVVFYLRTLKAPLPRDESNEAILDGKTLFTQIDCVSCHISEWTTPDSDISGLSRKTFYPYTDMLLHDMGGGLNDGYTEGQAENSEWRTPPLWGIGLSTDAQGGQMFLMHDGRATSIESAILLHGGEASFSRSQFEGLTIEQKEKLVKFLMSL